MNQKLDVKLDIRDHDCNVQFSFKPTKDVASVLYVMLPTPEHWYEQGGVLDIANYPDAGDIYTLALQRLAKHELVHLNKSAILVWGMHYYQNDVLKQLEEWMLEMLNMRHAD